MFAFNVRLQTTRLSQWGWVLFAGLVLISAGCRKQAAEDAPATPVTTPKQGRVTFVQWADPHIFDAGASRKDKKFDNGIEEERLDNWSALHWAVLQTNRLIQKDREPIDFVVITGDFGLYNVVLPAVGDYGAETCQRDDKEGPIIPIDMDEAATLVAQEFSALAVKTIYLVPGNNDLCNENPANVYRWAEFVRKLNTALDKHRKARQASLNCAKEMKAEVPLEPPDPPKVVDLTFTGERLMVGKDSSAQRFQASSAEQPAEETTLPCQSELHLEPVKNPAHKNPTVKGTTVRSSAQKSAPKKDGKPEGRPITGKMQPSQTATPSPQFVAPEEHGFHLLGLNSAYFKPSENEDIKKLIIDASVTEMNFVNNMISSEGPYLLFTHVPDLEDPYRASSNTDSGSSWKLPDTARKKWKDILRSGNLVAVFSSHFHDSRREIYPHNFTYAEKAPDRVAAQKIWVAPPLAAKVQSHRKVEQTARGMLLVRVTMKGTYPVPPQNGSEVEAVPIWFSPLDQKPPLPAEDKLIAARIDESNGNWDDAATKYKDLLDSDKTDSATRATALSGYVNAHQTMNTWWWESPITRWFYRHGRALFYSLALLLIVLVACWLLRTLRLSQIIFLAIRPLIIPRFKGRARLNNTTKMSPDAPVDGFPAQILWAEEEIRSCLVQEQEAWAANQIPLLVPAGNTFNELIACAPKVKDVDIGSWMKFIAAMIKLFQWNLDTGMAVLPPAGGPPPAVAQQGNPVPPPVLPIGGELTVHAALRWGWIVKNTWRHTVKIQAGVSPTTELARELAALILGEAFSK